MPNNKPHDILILALRRSGTTALWRLFRQNPFYTCFDEPFSRLLDQLPKEHKKGVRREFIDLYNENPLQFLKSYAPIFREEETSKSMTLDQKQYLRYLLRKSPIVIDVTRCHGKIFHLHSEMPDAVFIHLYRKPTAFVTSHLLPSDRIDLFGVRSYWERYMFFTRTRGFNRWGMEDLLRKPYAETTRELFDSEEIKLPLPGSTAIALLLAHWLGCYRLVQREGKKMFGSHFVSICFEEFCDSPKNFIDEIYQLAGAAPFKTDFSHIRNPGSPFKKEDPRWKIHAREVGFNEDEINRFL